MSELLESMQGPSSNNTVPMSNAIGWDGGPNFPLPGAERIQRFGEAEALEKPLAFGFVRLEAFKLTAKKRAV
jgi:hypothetical protein